MIEIIEDEAERLGFGFVERNWDERMCVEEIRLRSIDGPKREVVLRVNREGSLYTSRVAERGEMVFPLLVPNLNADYIREEVRKAAKALGVTR
jgi:hypothetical protein